MHGPEEITTSIHGLQVTGRAWGPSDGLPVLALHGWMDNAATWDRVAPEVVQDMPVRLVAIDLPGHGRSDHLAAGAWYGFPDYLLSTARVLDAFGWDSAVLLGHSMGGAVSTLVAGALSERVRGLALVEGLTPLTSSEDDARDQLRRGLHAAAKYADRSPRVYATYDALKARIAARPWKLTPPAVDALAARGSAQVEGGWAFTHDPRLRADSLVRFTPDQVRSFLRAVECPSLLFVAEEGLSYRKEEVASYLECLSDVRLERVPGRHHVHLDDPDKVSAPLKKFLSTFV